MAADQISLNRLNELHPAIKDDAIAAYLEAVQRTPVGVHPFITECYRSFKRSDELYAQGRTKPGPIVSKVKGGGSLHNYRLAIDFCLQINGKSVWDEKHPSWKIVVDCFKERGFEWGGDWKTFKDYPHFEKRLGYTTKQLLAKHNAGDFLPGNTYVNV